MEKWHWEYTAVSWLGTYAETHGRDELNRLGENGWELVVVCVQFNQHFAYLKRRKFEE